VLLDGVRIARQLLRTQARSRYVETETMPGVAVDRDDEALDFVRRTVCRRIT
jgi:choline dehydrogenase